MIIIFMIILFLIFILFQFEEPEDSFLNNIQYTVAASSNLNIDV